MLMRACEDVSLHKLKGWLDVWCQIAVISETKAYHTEEEREVIRWFCKDFSALIDAMYCIARAKKNDVAESEFSQELKEYVSNYYKPKNTPINPFDFPDYFFSLINVKGARSLLWILLEAVVIYPGELKDQLERSDIVITYERFLVILESAFFIKKLIKNRDRDNDKQVESIS